MDSSDDEMLYGAVTELEKSLLDPVQINDEPNNTNPFCETVNIEEFDANDLPDSKSLEILFKKFGHKKFRPLQWKIINSILKEKRDNCAIMTTGYGKSLCYQYPAIASGGITLVISPLISLMEDQVLALTIANIPSCLLGTAQKDTSKTMQEIFENKYSVIYLTPELCTGDSSYSFLKDMNSKLRITLIAIDEAHCVSSWGHDFRYSYRQLGILKDIFPKVPILAVTATATEKVRTDIVKVLKLKNPQTLCSGFDRPNLFLSAKPKSNDFLNDLKKLMIRRDGNWTFDGPTIIYCITRKDTEEICGLLNRQEIPCTMYHAGLPLSKRKEAHTNFVKDNISVIVATIAFGMGIDKPDIRNVIHYGVSSSVESYYQEIGRAGRDGLPSKCVAFYSSQDFQTHSFLLKDGNVKNKMELLDLIKEYMYSSKCRRQFILSYFQGKSKGLLPYRKDCCDNCLNKDTKNDIAKYEELDENGMYDFTDDTIKYLTVVDALGGTYGHGVYNLFIRGSKSSKIRDNHKNLSCYGLGKGKSEEWWKAIANFLEIKKYLKKERKSSNSFTYFVYDVSAVGRKFLHQVPNSRLIDEPPKDILNCLKKKTHTSEPSGWISADGWTTNCSTSRIKVNPIKQNPSPKKENAENEEEQVDKRLKLFRLLKDTRSKLAALNDCMPYMVASDFVLMEMVKHKPLDINELRVLEIEGLTEAKINKFGEALLEVIRKDTNEASAPKPNTLSIQAILEKYPISDEIINSSANVSYEYFKANMSVKDIADKRTLAVSTIVNHILSFVKKGYPIKLIDLGVSPKVRATILQVINSLGGQYDTIKLIKMGCPDDIQYHQIQAVCVYLKVRNHLNKLGIPYEDFEEFIYSEICLSSSNEKDDEFDDGSDDALLALCAEMQKQVDTDEKEGNLNSCQKVQSPASPPPKKARLNEILESPPREMESHTIVEESCKFKTICLNTDKTDSLQKYVESGGASEYHNNVKVECQPEKILASKVITAKKKLPAWLSKKK